MNTNAIVKKHWNYCNVLRDVGMSYGAYVEQLTYRLFHKIRSTERMHHSTLANAFAGKLISNHAEPVQGCGRNCESSPRLLRSWSLSA